jgi:hypothetical protein
MHATTRWKILGLAFAPFFVSSLLLLVLTAVGVVEKDPAPFDGRDFQAEYKSDNQSLLINSAKDKSLYHLTGSGQYSIPVNESAPKDTKKFTPFWLPFQNPVLTLDLSSPDFEIFDGPRLFGQQQKTYYAKKEANLILMDDVIQSQASYRFGIFDEKGRRAATAIYDATCGLLFRLQVKHPDKPDLRLVKTNFPISRNRIWLFSLYALSGGGLIWLLIRRARRLAGIESEIAWHHALWVLCGVVCLGTDTMIDIWHPFAFGQILPVLWHLAIVGVILVFAGRACIPAIAEVLMALILWQYIGGPAQTLFFIPGVTVAFIMALGAVKTIPEENAATGRR